MLIEQDGATFDLKLGRSECPEPKRGAYQRGRLAGPERRVSSVRDALDKHDLRIKPSMDEVDRLTGKRLGPEEE